jgi:chemotaxis protein methyltransferase CheR
MDVIFCRNVMLYFSPEQAVAGEAVLRDALIPGGWLFLGHSETLKRGQGSGQPLWLTHLFPGAPIYQKPMTSGVRLEATPASGISVARTPTPMITPVTLPPAPVTTARSTMTAPKLTIIEPVQEQPVQASVPFSVPSPPSDRENGYTHALSAYRTGDRAEAEHILNGIVNAQPESSQAWLLLACLAADRQQLTEAHRALDRALQPDPLLADAHYLRTLLYREEGQTGEAFHALRAALYCQRKHILAGYLMGTLYVESGEFYRAVKLWENVQAAMMGLAPDQFVSDFSEMTAGQLDGLIKEQLAGWKD